MRLFIGAEHSPGNSRHRRNIQALRGVAVIAVLLFHADETLFPLGYLGVDVFFVISGFVVTPLIFEVFAPNGSRRSQATRLRDFYTRRFYRLFPALSVTLIGSVFLILLFGNISDHVRFAKQGIATLLLAGNLGAYSFSGDYFASNPNPLIHTWSLGVEEQIYFFVPLLILLIAHNRGDFKRKFLALYFVITVISFCLFAQPDVLDSFYTNLGIQLNTQFNFYSPITRVWEFSLGGIGWLISKFDRRKLFEISGKPLYLISVLLCLILILLGKAPLEHRSGVIAVVLLTYGLLIKNENYSMSNALMSKLTWFGDRSYSIYLIHMPLLYIAGYSPAFRIGNGNSRIIQEGLAVLLTLILGHLSYQNVENRFRGGKWRSEGSKPRVFLFSAVAFLAPLLFLSLMLVGVSKHYWGLDRNIRPPITATELDANCVIDSRLGPACMYPSKHAKGSVLLIGDSHAGHLSVAFAAAAKASNLNAIVWTHPGCRVQFERKNSKEFSNDCLEANLKLKSWIDENDVNAIVISQFVHQNDPILNLQLAIKHIQKVNPNVLLIENTPVFPDIHDFMIMRPLIMSPYDPPKFYPSSKMNVKDGFASLKLSSWAKKNSIKTLNLSNLFCSQGICTRYQNGQWLFVDSNHLSVAGASLAIPQLRVNLLSLTDS